MVPELIRVFEDRLMLDSNQAVRESALAAWGAVMGRATDARARMKASESTILPLLKDLQQPLEIHRASAIGLATALSLWHPSARIETTGVRFLDASLTLAMQGVQRVQFAFNDVMWLALDVGSGSTDGLEQYCNMTIFDNQRSIKSLHSKVLVKIKSPTLLDS